MNSLSIDAAEILAYLNVVMVSIKFNNRQAIETEMQFLREAYQISPNEFQTAIGLLSELVVSLNQKPFDELSNSEKE